MTNRKRQQGFSLIELLIVVAIILVIAAISVPSLLAARRASMQSAGVGDLKTVVSAAANYNQEFPLGTGTATWTAFTLADLAGATCTGGYVASPTNACLIDSTLGAASATPGKDGYIFTFTATGLNAWTALADPIAGNLYGNDKHFFVDQSGLVRYAFGAPATLTSPLIGQ